jgi:DegV family protein with EDD domain
MTSKIAIVTDSACDLSNEILCKYNIRMIPLRIVYKSAEYRDRIDITSEQIYASLPTEIPKTSLPSPKDILQVYEQLVHEGITDVVHFCVSSGLSGTYEAMRIIVQQFKGKLNIRLIDTRSLSYQEGFLVLECARKLESGTDLDKAIEEVLHMRACSLGMFVVQTLDYLRAGGRIGLVEGVVGKILHIKPVIYVNDQGVYQSLAKVRGYKRALELMLKAFTERFGQKPVNIAVIYGADEQEGRALLILIKDLLNVKEHSLLSISPVLGVHTGPRLLGIVAYEV